MTIDTIAQQLHLRAARGEKLTTEEQARLDAWYAEMDRDEAEMFTRFEPAEDAESLRAQADAILTQVARVVQSTQTLAADNEKLRNEIAELEQKLIRKKAKLPA